VVCGAGLPGVNCLLWFLRVHGDEHKAFSGGYCGDLLRERIP
jgi:hypothetical protein